LEELARELRGLAGDIPVPRGGSIDHPYGFGFSEVPSTHLFTYPDLRIAIIHGFAAEQPKARGVQVAALVDPGTTDAQEIEVAVTYHFLSAANSSGCTGGHSRTCARSTI
jgi:hypothetical protein